MTYSMKLWSEILQIISGKKQTAVEDPKVLSELWVY